MASNFFALLQHRKIKALLTAEALLLCLIAAPQVAEAYLIQLAPPRAPSAPVSQITPGMLLVPAPGFVSEPAPLLRDLLMSAEQGDRRLMLWSVYPSSVRGRVFGGTGADPLKSSFSGSGSGSGGW